MPAHVVKRNHAVVAAHGKKHLAYEIETLVIAGFGNFREVTDHLPRGPENTFALEREKFRIGVGP